MTVKLTRPFYADTFTGNAIPLVRVTVKQGTATACLIHPKQDRPSAAQRANRAAFAAAWAPHPPPPP